MEYMNDFWLNVEEVANSNDQMSFAKLEEESTHFLNIDFERKEEEKQLAKPKKQIFTIIRLLQEKKTPKNVKINRSDKLKSKSKKENRSVSKKNKLNKLKKINDNKDITIKVNRKRIKKKKRLNK